MFSWATDDSQLLQYVYLFMVKMFCVKGISYTSTPKKRQTQPSIVSHTVSSTNILNIVGQPPADLLSTSSAVAEDVQPAVVPTELVSQPPADLLPTSSAVAEDVQPAVVPTELVNEPLVDLLSTLSAVAEDVQPAIVLAELVSELQRDLPLSGEMLISTLYS